MRTATDDESAILHRLHQTIVKRSEPNMQRDRFIRAKELLSATGITVPSSMLAFQVPLDWPRKAVEVFASRQVPLGYSTRTETTLLDDIATVAEESNLDFIERQAIEAADAFGCSFVFTSRGDKDAGEPAIMATVRSALAATAELDPRSGRVIAALELIGGTRVNLYLPQRVLTCRRQATRWVVEDEYGTGTSRVLCAVYVHGATLERPLGQSRVTPTIMKLTFGATRTLLRQEVAAEFYQAPRSVILGADSSVFDAKAAWSAVTGSVWGLPDVTLDDDPDMPDALRRASLQQIPQMSMQPFSDQYRLLASAMSGASSIPVHYLGVTQDSNPTSAEALQTIENDLVRAVRGQEPSFNIGRRNLALNILTALHGELDETRYRELRGLTPRWEDPRYRSMSEQSQFVALQVQTGNMQPGTEATLRQLPISPADAYEIRQDNLKAAGGSVVDRLLAAPQEQGAEVDELSKRTVAFGTLVRAGVKPESAAAAAGLTGLDFWPGQPVTIREPSDGVAG